MSWRGAALSWGSLALALAGPGVAAGLSRSIPEEGELAARAATLGLFAAIIAIVLIIAVRIDYAGRRELGFAQSSLASMVLAAPLAAFFILVYGPAAYWALETLNLPSFATGASSFDDLPRWYLAASIIFVAGGEEWLYRGYAIERLERLTGRPVVAATLSTAAFCLVHFPIWGAGPALTTAVSGGVLAGLYLWRRDVLMLMIAHIGTDLYGLAINPVRA